jgi:16S rRNA G966 N2-methylase RsmD
MDSKKIYIDRLFPDVIEKNLFHKLKIDYESIMYITIPQYADTISKIIIKHLHKLNIDIANAVITDATAGVGGDTISFAKLCKKVISIEVDQIRYNYLLNNICAYKIENIVLYCDDMIKIIPQIAYHDIIFIDPPWGGRNYKKNDLLRLCINDNEIEDCCIEFFNKEKNICSPKLIVLKLPSNYDINYIKMKLREYANIDIYNLYKMIIVVISAI